MMDRKKKLIITAIVTAGLLAASAASHPGRSALTRVVLIVRSGAKAIYGGSPSSIVAAGPDVEQRARGKHGWSTQITSVIARGTITYYKQDLVARQAGLTVYFKAPGGVRVETEHQGIIQASGFGADGEWQLRGTNLSDEEKRDIRSWLRLLPHRLFVARALSGRYRELGARVEAPRPAAPGRSRSEWDIPRVMDEVEVIDPIGTDQRAIYYLIDHQDATVSSARWIEPDNPRDSIDNPNAQTKEVRIDYGRWRRFNGLLLPMELTRWIAGKADLRIDLIEVLINQQLPDAMFQRP